MYVSESAMRWLESVYVVAPIVSLYAESKEISSNVDESDIASYIGDTAGAGPS